MGASADQQTISLQPTGSIRRRMISYLILFVLLVYAGLQHQPPAGLLKAVSDYSPEDLIAIGYWFAVLFLIAAALRLINRLRSARQLDRAGVTVPGKRTGRRRVEASYYTDFFLDYLYLDELQGAARVPSDSYHQARTGDPVLVTILNHSPHISRLELSSIPGPGDPSSAADRPTPYEED